MQILTILAIYFVLWWLILFTMLPIGLRTQEDDQNITFGTEASAPSRAPLAKIFIRTSVVTALIIGAFAYVHIGLGYTFDDLPLFVPDNLARQQ